MKSWGYLWKMEEQTTGMRIQARGLRKHYGTLEVLRGVDFELRDREVVSVVGASGAGKSTLLQILGTLDTPDQGNVYYGDDDVFSLRGERLSTFRNQRVGFVFQFHNLLPEFSAAENVSMPGWIGKRGEKEVKQRAEELLVLLGLKDRLTHKPNQLSGGEQQRVAVARALINQPDVILADEPSGNLDSKNAEELHQLFFRLRDELSQSFVIVTHNPGLAKLADRVCEMRDGVIIP